MTTMDIASQIMLPAIGKVAPAVYREMELAIDKALRDEREACAVLARNQPCTCDEPEMNMHRTSKPRCQVLIGRDIASAIRERD